MKATLSLLLTACLTACAALGIEVEATGSAPGDVPEARAQALSDALREAVRQGAGVDLVSETQATDFALDFDRTFSKARGYVRKYQVLSSELRSDGIYTVTIKADVGELAKGISDKMTFQMMAREHQAPRVAIRITEKIGSMPDSKVAADWLRNTATECGLKVVETSGAQGDGGMLAKRAAALGRGQEASMRGNGIVSACDYIIEGEITGAMTGEQSFYGSKPAKRFSLGANLRVIDAATGLVMLTETASSRDILVRQVSSDDAAVREAVRQIVEGSPRVENSDSGWKLIRRIFSSWAAETDLGATIKLEFAGLDLASAQALQKALAGQKGVGAIWVRSVDTAGISVIDCESRLDSTTLASVVTRLAPQFTLDRSEKRYLSFRKDDNASGAAPAAGAGDTASSGDGSGMLIAILGGIAALIAAIAVATIVILKKKAPAKA